MAGSLMFIMYASANGLSKFFAVNSSFISVLILV